MCWVFPASSAALTTNTFHATYPRKTWNASKKLMSPILIKKFWKVLWDNQLDLWIILILIWEIVFAATLFTIIIHSTFHYHPQYLQPHLSPPSTVPAVSFILPSTKAPIWLGEYTLPCASTHASPLLARTILYDMFFLKTTNIARIINRNVSDTGKGNLGRLLN